MAKKNKKSGKNSGDNMNQKNSSGDSSTMSGNTCSTGCGGVSGLLCTLSMVAAVFFLISLLPALGTWVTSISWWIWLLVAIILGYKPMMKCYKK